MFHSIQKCRQNDGLVNLEFIFQAIIFVNYLIFKRNFFCVNKMAVMGVIESGKISLCIHLILYC